MSSDHCVASLKARLLLDIQFLQASALPNFKARENHLHDGQVAIANKKHNRLGFPLRAV
jgi:hypothetical protein